MKKAVWVGVALGVALLAGLWWMTMSLRRHRVEVCMEFRGRVVCRVASGATKEQAQRQAVENACGLLASGVTDTIACQNTPPRSVRWLSEE